MYWLLRLFYGLQLSKHEDSGHVPVAIPGNGQIMILSRDRRWPVRPVRGAHLGPHTVIPKRDHGQIRELNRLELRDDSLHGCQIGGLRLIQLRHQSKGSLVVVSAIVATLRGRDVFELVIEDEVIVRPW